MKKERRRQLAALLSAAVFGSSMSAHAETESPARQLTGGAARSAVITNPLCPPGVGAGQAQIGAPTKLSGAARSSGQVIRNEFALPGAGTIEIGPARLRPPSAPARMASPHDVVPAGHSSTVRLVKPREAVLSVEPRSAHEEDSDASGTASANTEDDHPPLHSSNAVVFKLNDLDDELDAQNHTQPPAQEEQKVEAVAGEVKLENDAPPSDPAADARDGASKQPLLFRPRVRILKPVASHPPAAETPVEPSTSSSPEPVKLGGNGFVGSISDDTLRSPEPLVQVGKIGDASSAEGDATGDSTIDSQTIAAPRVARLARSASPPSLAAKDQDPAAAGETDTIHAVPKPSANSRAEADVSGPRATARRAMTLAAPIAAAVDTVEAAGEAAPAESVATKTAPVPTHKDADATGEPDAMIASATPTPLLKIRRPAGNTAAPAEQMKDTAVIAAARPEPQVPAAAAIAVKEPLPVLIKAANQPPDLAIPANEKLWRGPRAAQPVAAEESSASDTPERLETVAANPSTERLQLAVGTPFTFETRQRIARVQLEDDGLCEAVQIDPRRIMMVGKSPGTCRLAVWFEAPAAMSRQLIEVDVTAPAATNELSQLSEKLAMILIATYPDQRLRIDVDGKSLVVKGRVSSEDIARDALRIVRNTCLRPVKDEIEVLDR